MLCGSLENLRLNQFNKDKLKKMINAFKIESYIKKYLCSFITNRSCGIKIRGNNSKKLNCPKGLLQSSIYSSSLFGVYNSVTGYADDFSYSFEHSTCAQ
ncbi:hypothetical protein MHBO_002233 [Bonamia ostreae]|uniref:Reverse transcriptase n=1 Tax=Bonamia ostreae TaxID=126728 RepID=A0ABV2ALL8_9EUKA